MSKLTAIKVRNAKPKDTAYKLSDGYGMHLHIAPTGVRTWRYRFRIDGKESTYTLGEYPEMSLEKARAARTKARETVKEGKNPAQVKRKKRLEERKQQIEEKLALQNTFQAIALEWIENQRTGWSRNHADAVRDTLKADAFAKIGDMPVDDISPPMILDIIRTIEDRGALEMARKVLQRITAVFRYAIQTGRATYNPAAEMKGVLKPKKVQHRPAFSAEELPKFLKALHASDIYITTRLAIEFTLLTATRSGEVRGATWDEIKLDDKLWKIPGSRMKMNTPHTIPLSEQAVAILKQAGELFGQAGLIFPGIRQGSPQLSENTMLYALYRLGYHSKATIHGLRATFSTIANEAGFDSDVIEKALAHEERNKVRAAYHRSEYIEQRRELMQWWADYLQTATESVSA